MNTSRMRCPAIDFQMAKRKTSGSEDEKVSEALAKIKKAFGKDIIQCLGAGEVQPVEVIPTGSLALDRALGVGGYARGRIVELYGPESGGKTTLTLHAIAEAQARGLRAAFIDAEHALDVKYAGQIGVDCSKLYLCQPDYGEQALEVCNALVESGAFGIVVVDSVAALTPKAELEGEMGDSHVGLQPRMMGQALRKMTGTVNRTNTTVIFINQTRMKIGVMFGSPETTPGGNALKFFASQRLRIGRIASVKKGEDAVGNRVRVKVQKNKLAPPFKEAEFEISFGVGIDKEAEAIEFGEKVGVVDKAGSWLALPDGTRVQGKQALVEHLRENPEVLASLQQKIAESLDVRT